MTDQIRHQSSVISHLPTVTLSPDAPTPPRRLVDRGELREVKGRTAMLIVPGQAGKDLCDPHLGYTRRDLMRVGGSGLLGLSLGSMLELQAASAAAPDSAALTRRPGWGRAKSIIMVYFQGGPSHLDLWDPKDNIPDSVRIIFKAIDCKMPGTKVTEILPNLAAVTDKFSFIRSMSYTPNGLFNHTA